uniref:Uncharacterized protein n=1 Tax=Arundo donax TaxID=35708 RepID=A0A0A9C4L1_ARUDO
MSFLDTAYRISRAVVRLHPQLVIELAQWGHGSG